MTRRRAGGWVALGLFLTVASGGAAAAAWQVPGGDDPPPAPLPALEGQPPGAEVLTQGPLHEAFAEPVVYDPKPGPVVPKQPPPPIEETPPDQRPEGGNVQWIPGYWAWDDGRNDFLWVSGLWRDIPPGRQWVPGYWVNDAGGYRWVAGAWVAETPQTSAVAAAAGAQVQTVQYLPAPPASLEVGPSSPMPMPGAVWVPGCWMWQASQYAWRPGFWIAYQADWVWSPAHYVWTPGGYLFVSGYWDRAPARRGICFAPVYFAQPVYAQPRFVYTPTITLVASALMTSLFVRPASCHYYFGDYYAASYYNTGIYPAYSFHQSRYGYDPVFAHMASVNVRRDPAWLNQVHEEYRFRREHPEARPPHTYVALREAYARQGPTTVINRTTVVNQKTVNITRNLVVARPISQIAANPRLLAPAGASAAAVAQARETRFTRVDQARRAEMVQQATALQRFRDERRRQETVAIANPRPDVRPGNAQRAQAATVDRPRQVNFARSPIAAAAVSARGPGRPGPNLPTLPQAPPVEPATRPHPAADPRFRPEPHPDRRPEPFTAANLPPDGQRRLQELRAAQLREQQEAATKNRLEQQRQAQVKSQQEQMQQRQAQMKAQQEAQRKVQMKAQQEVQTKAQQEQQRQAQLKALQEQRRQAAIKAAQEKQKPQTKDGKNP